MQNRLAELLEGKTSVAIGGHVRPDGDCVGSCMGLYLYLRENFEDIDTDVYLEKIPSHFSFLKGTEMIRHEADAGKKYDLFICLDCGDEERLGRRRSLRARATPSAWTTISATRRLRRTTASCRTQAPHPSLCTDSWTGRR